jgi:hypothetical protein
VRDLILIDRRLGVTRSRHRESDCRLAQRDYRLNVAAVVVVVRLLTWAGANLLLDAGGDVLGVPTSPSAFRLSAVGHDQPKVPRRSTAPTVANASDASWCARSASCWPCSG